MNITTTFVFDNWEEFLAFIGKLDGATMKKSKITTTATVGPDLTGVGGGADLKAVPEATPASPAAATAEDVEKERERIRKVQKKYTENPPAGLGMKDQVRVILKNLGATTVSTLDPSNFKQYEEELLKLG